MQHEISKHALTGGAELLVINVPNSISFYFGSYIRNGHRFCDPAKYEVPHLLEHLAFEGNKTHPEPIQFKTAIEKLGAGFNAHTGNSMTYYHFVAGLEHLTNIIDIAIDQIFEPLIKNERVDQQKRVITQELTRFIDDDRKNNGYRHLHGLFPSLCPDFKERVDMLQGITADDVRRYHHDTYGVANTFYVLSGNFRVGQIKQVVAQLNTRLKRYPIGEAYRFSSIALSNLGSVVIYDSKIPTQDHFYLSFNMSGVDHVRMPSLKLLATIFGVGSGSRMQTKVREVGLTYGFHAAVGCNFDKTSLSMFDQTSPDKVVPLIQLAMQELSNIAAGNFNDEEFERAQGLMLGGLKRSLQTPAALAGWYDGKVLYGWPLESPQERLKALELVTRESIKEAADEYIKRDNWLLTMTGQNLEHKKNEYVGIINRYFA